MLGLGLHWPSHLGLDRHGSSFDAGEVQALVASAELQTCEVHLVRVGECKAVVSAVVVEEVQHQGGHLLDLSGRTRLAAVFGGPEE